MPDPHSHNPPSRKLGGIPQGEDTSPSIYRKPPSFEMHTIERPSETKSSANEPSAVPGYLGLLAVILLVGGGAAYLYYKTPPQLTALLQRLQAPPPRIATTGGPAPEDSTPLAENSPGFVWLFDEKEWRTPADPQQEYKEGLLHLHNILEKPQLSADGTIRARLVVREGGGMAGVFLRSTPEGGRYRLAIDPDLRFVRLVHQGPSGTQELGKYRFFKSLLRGARLTLELHADGESLSASVNGERVIEAEDSRSPKAGSWGIESGDAWFELVEVPVPPPKAIVEATPPAPAEPAAPAPATPVPMAEAAPAPIVQLSETGKWLGSMEPQWQAKFEQDVLAPYQKSVDDLKKQFQATLETQLATATQGRKLDDAAFFRGERKRLEAGEDVPMTDESIVPPALKSLRNGYRNELVRIDRERFGRARTFFARIESLLAQREALLVQRRQNEEVTEIKKKREQLAALWVKPPISITVPVVAVAGATPAPVRLPLGATPAPSMAKMPPKQVVEKLLAMGAGVGVTHRGATTVTDIKTISDLTGERFMVTRVDLRRANAEEKPITTEDLSIIDALIEVTDLGLHGPAVTDAIVEKLRPFRHLDRLTIEGAKIGTASATVLATLPDLRELRLSNLGLGDEAVKAIGQCRKMERLTLASLAISDAALAPIGKLPSLQELDLNNLDKVTSVGLGHIAECHSLRRLSLTGSSISSPMLDAVARCTGLESLNLGGNALKDEQIAGLSALTRLHTLNLNNTGIVGKAFITWPARAALTTLNLTNQPGVDDAALKAIGAAFPKLETLEISGVPLGATAVGFAAVGRLRSLRTLHVGGGVVNDEIMVEIGKCNDLQSLSIPGGRLGEPGVAALTKLTRLTSLDVGLPPVSDAALKSFSRCKALKSIQISAEAPPEIETKLRAALNGVTIRK